MKESISLTTILQIVILFILLFTAIMALTINNSNAFGMKDKIVNIIELDNGNFQNASGGLSDEIVATLDEATYRTTGKCDVDAGFRGFSRTGEEVPSGNKAAVCIKEVHVTDEIDAYLSSDEVLGDTVATGDSIKGTYYQIVVFYQLDIPLVNQVYNFSTKGETKIIYQN